MSNSEDVSEKQSPPGTPSARPFSQGLARRIIPPLLVLIVAGGIYLYAQHQREQQVADVEAVTEQLCRDVAAIPPGGARPSLAMQLNASLTTVERLQDALSHDPDLDTLHITILRGDAPPPYGDGSATHQAFVDVEGQSRIVLRFYHPGDAQRLQLIGFWTP